MVIPIGLRDKSLRNLLFFWSWFSSQLSAVSFLAASHLNSKLQFIGEKHFLPANILGQGSSFIGDGVAVWEKNLLP